ncbi:YhgE/Pip domain-containing protein [Microbacterium sp. cx-59]|uniref:YhgE/Pip domain-containing protein n=1 Tax=Microbacterium sp. cx-59 TaxID=2891207 RepID=UPI001E580DE3|nr:YhgE/Pip family protein [Microbacterium sp. cx-59]MCC4909119.1 YhgE/Pip family protein [Microbacterium sp. cx-59]
MTLPVERSRSGRPITWLTVVGVLLLPVVMGALLVAALYNPAERLGNMTAAIVNDDKAVEIQGQLAPLGRQLTGGLVAGSDQIASNLDWTISNDEDAAEGLADGTYSAIVRIPENFSAAATSTAGTSPEQATIEVQTAPDGRIVDDAITAQITQAAATVFGTEVSKTYLENVLLGFTTLHDQLGDAASGAHEIADGADQAASGATTLATGADDLSAGVGQIASGAQGIADGAGALSSGANQLASGASAAASGLGTLAGSADTLAAGNRQLSDGLNTLAGSLPPGTAEAAGQLAASTPAITEGLAQASDDLSRLAAQCDPAATPDLCASLSDAAADAEAALPVTTRFVTQAGQLAGGLSALPGALQALAASSSQLADGTTALAGGARQAADGVGALSSGAAQLATGASTLQGGAAQLATGAASAASGSAELATGANALGTGVGQVASGTRTLADGLDTAVAQVPTYSDEQATSLATVVADPVAAEGVGTDLFGASAIPLLAMLVLWFGGLGSFVVLRAVSAHTLTSRRTSLLLTLRAFAPAALIGAAQGALVAVVVQIAASYDWADWSLFAALCVAAGIAFAAVNQALVALFGGAGRWISAVVGALALATGVVSTVPSALTSAAGLLPTAPAYSAMLGALTSTGGVGAALVGMLVWSTLALIATTLVVAQRRKVRASAVLTASAP